jgi:hypothetical protein
MWSGAWNLAYLQSFVRFRGRAIRGMSQDPSRLPLRSGSVAAKELESVSVRIYWDPTSRDASGFKGNEMATAPQLNPYRCEQCGTPDIVAVHLLYEQGTRTYSGMFHSGISQSYSAGSAAPPRPRGYARPLLLWGIPTFLLSLWSYAGLSSLLERPTVTATAVVQVVVFLILGLACLGSLVLKLRNISRYNREVYPRLHWDWSHTYMCRRCGNRSLISA